MANLSIIRELCKEKNISLKKLGEEIGITTPQGVQRMINENSTTIDRLEKIAKLLDVPIWRFFDPDLETAYIMEIEQQKNRSKINEETLEEMTKVIADLKRKNENVKTVTLMFNFARELVAYGRIDKQHYEILIHLLIDFLESNHDDTASEKFMSSIKPLLPSKEKDNVRQ